MQDEHSLGGWLNVFQGVMDYAESSANFKNMDLFKAWDGAVLAHIAEGIDAVYSGVTPTTCAGEQWANFFESLVAQQGRNPSISDDLLKHLWGVAEQQAIEEGKAYAKANSTYSAEDLRMVLTLKGVTDGYRQSARENTGLFGGIGPVQFKVADPRIDRVFIADLAKSAEGVWVNKPKFDELVPPDIDRSTGCVSDPGPASRDWLADFRRGEHNTGPAETGDTGGGSNTVETPDSLADFRRGEHNTGPAETDQTGGPSQSIEVPDLLPNFTAEEHSPGEPTSNDGDGGDGATSDGPATSDIEIAA